MHFDELGHYVHHLTGLTVPPEPKLVFRYFGIKFGGHVDHQPLAVNLLKLAHEGYCSMPVKAVSFGFFGEENG